MDSTWASTRFPHGFKRINTLKSLNPSVSIINCKVQSTAADEDRNFTDSTAHLGDKPFFISLVGQQEYAETFLSKMEHMINLIYSSA